MEGIKYSLPCFFASFFPLSSLSFVFFLLIPAVLGPGPVLCCILSSGRDTYFPVNDGSRDPGRKYAALVGMAQEECIGVLGKGLMEVSREEDENLKARSKRLNIKYLNTARI